MRKVWFKTIRSYLKKIAPKQYESPFRLQFLTSLSVGLGLFSILFFNSQFLALENENLYLCLPFLGTYFLLFFSPSSKTSQPLSIIFGYTTSAFIAIACMNLLSNPVLAMLLALTLCLVLMRVVGVIHFPALLIVPVITHFEVHSYSYIFIPVFCDALIIVVLGLLIHPLMRKKYPYKGNS
jgi:CBS domain-containing membrane protein